MVTVLMAIGTNLSALWILIANGWMQNPVGAAFNFTTMRMELTDFWVVLFNPDAQAKFVHTVSAGYVTGAMFVLSISSWYLLQGRDVEFAKRSFRVAAAFGLASALSVIVLGDESGYTVGEAQQTKLAALEAMWETHPAPAPLTLFGIPDEAHQRTRWAIEIPWVMGLIGTRSADKEIPGIRQIKERNRVRILSGILAVKSLARLRQDPSDGPTRSDFERHKADLGFGLLLRRYADRIEDVTPADIQKAVDWPVPCAAPMFWSVRAMFATSFWSTLQPRPTHSRWQLKWALLMLPAPWIAAELGWFVAEYGRQPWTIYGVLPTYLSASTQSVASLYGSLAGFILFYTALLAVEMYLMIRYARQGPGSLGTGRYAGELHGHRVDAAGAHG
jgi:cytochrome d ubiquinol oxidase subunit I